MYFDRKKLNNILKIKECNFNKLKKKNVEPISE